MAITRDSLVSELPGVSPAQAVALNRLGIDRVGDLLGADYERVAVTLESFDEATRLMREANRAVQDSAAAKEGPARGPAPQPTPAPRKPAGRHRPHAARASSPARPPAAPAPVRARPPAPASSPPLAPRHVQPPRPAPQGVDVPMPPISSTPSVHEVDMPTVLPHPIRPKPVVHRRDDEGLGLALSLAARGIDLAGGGEEARHALARRLSAAALLLEHGSPEDEPVAALILEGVEDGSVQANALDRVFSESLARTIEECTSLRAIPVSPLGKLPRYYLEMAARASAPARRVCAALQLSHLGLAAESGSRPDGSPGGVAWYARLLVEALESGGPEPLVAALRSALDTDARAAA